MKPCAILMVVTWKDVACFSRQAKCQNDPLRRDKLKYLSWLYFTKSLYRIEKHFSFAFFDLLGCFKSESRFMKLRFGTADDFISNTSTEVKLIRVLSLCVIQSDHDDDYASAAEDSIRGTSPTPSSGRSTPPRPRDRSPGQVWTPDSIFSV